MIIFYVLLLHNSSSIIKLYHILYIVFSHYCKSSLLFFIEELPPPPPLPSSVTNSPWQVEFTTMKDVISIGVFLVFKFKFSSFLNRFFSHKSYCLSVCICVCVSHTLCEKWDLFVCPIFTPSLLWNNSFVCVTTSPSLIEIFLK